MAVIDVKAIENAVYELCYRANICLDEKIYSKIFNAYKSISTDKNTLSSILENARIAYETKKPLCQDTGQVLVFLEIGQDVQITGGNLAEIINKSVAKCYKDNYFRKSVVKNALFDRSNTNDNTPCIIYTEIVQGSEIKVDVLIKGAGSENKSISQMLLPTASREEVKEFISDCVLSSGINSCPPLFIGVGIGGTIDKASILAKKSFLANYISNENKAFAQEVRDYINLKAGNEFGESYVLDLNILTAPTHIACMPVAISINCHASRKASCVVTESEISYFNNTVPKFEKIEVSYSSYVKINTNEIEKIRQLKTDTKVLLSGEIYIARDAAHKRMIDLINNNRQLPMDIKDKIIFYAGPCPPKPGEIIGSIGPTTSSRMDNFAPVLYDKGLLATIGKGNRSKAVQDSINNNSSIYFSAIGGIASYLSAKITESKIIAFEDLGVEAIYKIKADNLPLKVEIGR